jgi:hypothetical protein
MCLLSLHSPKFITITSCTNESYFFMNRRTTELMNDHELSYSKNSLKDWCIGKMLRRYTTANFLNDINAKKIDIVQY